MRRRLLTIAIFLLAGAVVNVGVAWGCAVRPKRAMVGTVPIRPKSAYYRPSDEAKEWWVAHAPASFPVKPIAAAPYSWFGANTMSMWTPDPDNQKPDFGDHVARRRTGWPLRSMEGAVWFRGAIFQVIYDAAVPIGAPATGCLTPPSWLPLRPLWPDFAANTAFYAGILWLLIPGPFALRRLIRDAAFVRAAAMTSATGNTRRARSAG